MQYLKLQQHCSTHAALLAASDGIGTFTLESRGWFCFCFFVPVGNWSTHCLCPVCTVHYTPSLGLSVRVTQSIFKRLGVLFHHFIEEDTKFKSLDIHLALSSLRYGLKSIVSQLFISKPCSKYQPFQCHHY